MTRKSLRQAKTEANIKGREGTFYYNQMRLIQKKNEYLTNLISGRYYTERCNMITEQLNSGNIQEKIDGATKTKNYMLAEYGLMKLQAVTRMRNAHFAKEDLKTEFKMTETEVEALEKGFYDEKIIRDNYGDEFRKPNKAEFVAEPENKKS